MLSPRSEDLLLGCKKANTGNIRMAFNGKHCIF